MNILFLRISPLLINTFNASLTCIEATKAGVKEGFPRTSSMPFLLLFL